MSVAVERRSAWEGPAVLSYGFRPFFLGASIWAALAMALWVAMLAGIVALPTRLAPIDWHAHEFLYGYLPAVVAGFLLTAIPSWTDRRPVAGWLLLALCLTWIAGRVAVAASALMPATLAAAVDLAFLGVLVLVTGREIVAGQGWRNLPVLCAVALLGLGNAVFHVEAADGAAASGWGGRIGVAVAVFLILLVGGRIVPAFTRNWLARRRVGYMPAAASRLDAAAVVVGAAALLLWIAGPEARTSGIACLAAGLLHLVRLGRWAGWRTAAEPLVAILHVGYAFAPIGFLAVAASVLLPGSVAPSAALHAWTVGAVGIMTLAVMTRASLGHTGRALVASRATTAIYAAIIGAALARVAHGIAAVGADLHHLAAGLWILAFAGFAVVFFPLLTKPRLASASS